MSMATRCPACSTVFRVTPPQLQSHRGKVRCGRCAHVFDGFAALVTLPDQSPAEPRGPAPENVAALARQAERPAPERGEISPDPDQGPP